MDFHLVTNNSSGEFVGAVMFLFAIVDTVLSAVADTLRGGSIEGFGGVK